MFRRAAIALLAAAAWPACAQDLYPGAKAPELKTGAWLKHGLKNGLEPGKAYVVEFWATWCGPCIESIPHLTELAKKYKGQVEFVGVSVWERGKPVPEIQKFVDGMGEKMDYHVAVDDGEWMAKNWMAAAKQNGIPASFLVSDGVVQWIGHPMELDRALEQWASKTLDVEKNKSEFLKEIAQEEAAAAERKAVADAIKAATTMYEGGEREAAVAKLDALAKQKPSAKLQVASAKLNLFAKHDPVAAEALVAEIAAGKAEEWRFLASYAYGTLRATTPEAKELGLKALMAAMHASADNDVLVCYYASLYYKESGKKEEALKCIDRAIALFPTSDYKNSPALLDALKKLRAEISA